MFIDAAFAGMDIELAAGDLSFNNSTPAIDRFFEAAETTAMAEVFPFCCLSVFSHLINHNGNLFFHRSVSPFLYLGSPRHAGSTFIKYVGLISVTLTLAEGEYKAGFWSNQIFTCLMKV